MVWRGFGRLEPCWKTLTFIPPSRLTPPQLHTQLKHHNTLLSCNSRSIALNSLFFRNSSFIVKSQYKDIDIPKKLITELVWETVDRFPEATAVKCGLTGRSYTFAEIQKQSYKFANSLRQAGFIKGDIIALVLPNCPEFAFITLGALEAELSLTFINHDYTSDEMYHQLMDSGSVCVVVASEKLENILSAVAKVEEKTQSKPFRRIIAVDIPPPESLPSGVVRLTEMIGSNVDASAKTTREVRPMDLAFLPYSSGTTGLPKGVCLSHRNIVANITQLTSLEELAIRSPEKGQDILLGILPFFHIYGLVVVLLSSIAQGGQVITLPRFEPISFLTTLEKEKLSALLLVPPLILFLGYSDYVQPKHLAHLRFLVSGAAPLKASDMERLKGKLASEKNCILQQAYGMTELSPVATVPLIPAKNLATIGVPVANTSAKVINPDTGDSLGLNELGELCFKGPQVMLGYHNNPKATSDMLDSEGWLRSGDLGYYDEDNHFYIEDRLKELIKVKGFQVPPAELENVLRSHRSVIDAAVIGVPCPRSGQVPVAYIVTNDKKLTADDIKGFLSDKVAQHKQVSQVIFISSIPKSASGTILRKDLIQQYKHSDKS